MLQMIYKLLNSYKLSGAVVKKSIFMIMSGMILMNSPAFAYDCDPLIHNCPCDPTKEDCSCWECYIINNELVCVFTC